MNSIVDTELHIDVSIIYVSNIQIILAWVERLAAFNLYFNFDILNRNISKI
jgi:hypothetical protein